MSEVLDDLMDRLKNNFNPTSGLRWLRPAGTTTKPDRLQQAWYRPSDKATEWRDVPLHVEAPPAPQKQGRG